MKYGVHFFFSHLGLSIERSVVKFFNFWQLERTFAAGMMQGLFGEIPKLAFWESRRSSARVMPLSSSWRCMVCGSNRPQSVGRMSCCCLASPLRV